MEMVPASADRDSCSMLEAPSRYPLHDVGHPSQQKYFVEVVRCECLQEPPSGMLARLPTVVAVA